jgi:hypothetical protein
MKGTIMSAKEVVSWKTLLIAVIAAALGGISPNLMSLGIMLTTGEGELPQLTYVLGLLIFALLGGAVSFFWREIDPKRAFFLGLGLPSIIQIGINDLSNQTAPEPPPTNLITPVSSRTDTLFSLTSTVMAQGKEIESETSAIQGRKVLIEIDKRFFSETPLRDQLAVLYDQPNQRNSTRAPIPVLSTFIDEQKKDRKTSNSVFVLQWDVPETAKTFRIQVGKQYSQLVKISTTPRQADLYQLRYIEDKWSGFKRAIGQRSASTYRIELHSSGPAPISFDNYAKFIEERGRYNWFKWETFVVANQTQLNDIIRVEYKLHKTFSPQPPATDRSTKFAISMEGWGSFWVHAIVYHSKGKQTNIQYYLDLRKGEAQKNN